ncbi:MBL fold metallo-hydrolase [Kribbella yunnanensis]|uniref:MBL fold metallo-hydrolase n=1 Tax=Kribbella yunnanensis TaxID=190194 RepID=UPI003CD0806D
MVLVDAPPSIGVNLQRAIDLVTKIRERPNKVTHLIYSHSHADHIGAASLFERDVVRIGHAECRRLLLRAVAAGKRPQPPGTDRDVQAPLHGRGRQSADRAGLPVRHTRCRIHRPAGHACRRQATSCLLPRRHLGRDRSTGDQGVSREARRRRRLHLRQCLRRLRVRRPGRRRPARPVRHQPHLSFRRSRI